VWKTGRGGPCYSPSRKSAVSTPEKTCAVGPVIQTPVSRQSTAISPPSRVRRTERPVRPAARGGHGHGAGGGAGGQRHAGAPFPDAHAQVVGGDQARELHIGAFGEEGVVLDLRAARGEVHGLGVIHEEGAMRVAHGGGDRIAVDGQVQGVGGLGQRDVGPVGHGAGPC
jgi:hypothetical protein